MRLPDVEHHLERMVAAAACRPAAVRVLEYHIVVRHAVDQQQRIADLERIVERVGR